MEVIIKKVICLRCGHKWFPKPTINGIVNKPTVCPKCKSPYYDRKRILRKSDVITTKDNL